MAKLEEEKKKRKITCTRPGWRRDRDGIKYVAIFNPKIPPPKITQRYQYSHLNSHPDSSLPGLNTGKKKPATKRVSFFNLSISLLG